MAFDTTWDINKYKDITEYEQHWHLRKSFLQAHKNKYPEDRLVALSKVFGNMEFMGCIYNSECMLLVKNLAKQVPEIVQYWEDKKNKISRTFVKASDAVKRNKSESKDADNKRIINFVGHTESKDNIFPSKKFKSNNTEPSRTIKDDVDWELYQKARAQAGVKGKLIIYDNKQEKVTLFQSAAKSRLTLKYQTEKTAKPSIKIHQLKIDEEIVSQLQTDKSLNADVKSELAANALKELKKYCFTITSKDNFETVTKTDTKQKSKTTEDPSALQGGIGAKIMRQMGWKGTGLGKNESGIETPIEATVHVRKIGLGNDNNDKGFARNIKKYLEDYLKSGEKRPLQFSAEFSKDQRQMIHNIVQKMPLKSQSYGKGEQRAIRIQRKIEGWTLVEDLLANGGTTVTHSLIRPTNIS